LVPARMVAEPGRFFVYLMERGDRGFRIGRTKSYRPDARGRPQTGYVVRLNQEHADALWILRVCGQETEAAFWEAYYAASYGLPTTCFHPLGRGLTRNDDWIAELYETLDTRCAAKHLMEDLDLHPEFPHYRPQNGLRRQSVNLTMFSDTRPRGTGYHRIQWCSNRRDIAEQLRRAGYSLRPGKGGWRVETSRKDYREALELVHSIAQAGSMAVSRRAWIDGDLYALTPLSHLRPGMRVLVEEGGRFVEASVESSDVELHDGPVYDLEVDELHTYIANGMVVHNSVYSFRGATIRNLLDFERDYPDATVVKLTQNYRSTQTILDAANAVIRHNITRQPKELWTDKGVGPNVVRYEAEDERDEAAFIAEEVERLRAQGIRFGDVAVFYRTNAQSRVLEEVFVRVGTPYRVIGGVRFYERKEIKDLLAYLRVLVNPADDLSVKRIINTPLRGIGAKTTSHLDLHAARERISFLEACRQAERIPHLGARQLAAIGRFVALLDVLQVSATEGMALPDLLEAVWTRSGYLEELQAERTIEARGREENLGELASVAREYHEREPEGGLAGFLEAVALMTEQDDLTEDTSAVTFMTLHNAKGLEFPVVFLAGMEDGVFPHVRTFGDAHELEEERRLCYVGLTRARERLYVVHAYHRSLWGGVSYNPPSRFLRELPDDVEVRSADRGSAARRVRDREVLTFEGQDFRVDDRVHHTRFGMGRVVELAGEGESAEALVDFAAVGPKRLLLAYAPLVRDL
ncbi:MAG: ATP-binding domain-containing protein, partial [Actinomycetota bacterium]|nr:ATP-binding domain-containing protein [Actinomycetota bacterium]